jgi:hypothetical protein
MTDLSRRIEQHLTRIAGPTDVALSDADNLLAEAMGQIATLTADRDAGWRMARAAAEGHDHCRELLLEIGRVFDRKVDDIDGLPARVKALQQKLTAAREGETVLPQRLTVALQAALTMAGAPPGPDAMAWASDVRNRALGRQAQIDELVTQRRDYYTARENELAEFRAAAESLPDVLKPGNGYPYSIACTTPIAMFMLLRERALALVNPSIDPPVSGA